MSDDESCIGVRRWSVNVYACECTIRLIKSLHSPATPKINLAYKYHPVSLFNLLIIFKWEHFLEKIRIRQMKFIFRNRVADPHHSNADPDPAFHFNADPDLLIIKVMRIFYPTSLVYRPSRASFWATKTPLKARFQLFTFMQIRIQLPKIMRIRIRNPDEECPTRYICSKNEGLN